MDTISLDALGFGASLAINARPRLRLRGIISDESQSLFSAVAEQGVLHRPLHETPIIR
jgi:hypothetical protein